ncbi:glycine-rich protein 1-like [Molothrus aeneus]|uniref:glycine-rich protein 1-like n=1 Tax=Molothrus aeneus TaxID=84833 RepID=UPI00345849DD
MRDARRAGVRRARDWGYSQGVRMDGCKGDEGRERRGADTAEPPDGGRTRTGRALAGAQLGPALSDSAAAHSQRGARDVRAGGPMGPGRRGRGAPSAGSGRGCSGGTARGGTARLGTARLGSARHGTARHGTDGECSRAPPARLQLGQTRGARPAAGRAPARPEQHPTRGGEGGTPTGPGGSTGPGPALLSAAEQACPRGSRGRGAAGRARSRAGAEPGALGAGGTRGTCPSGALLPPLPAPRGDEKALV